MPGAKRKIDEDAWLAKESKKFKYGQILSNVHDSTLAKLRLGARAFFQDLNAQRLNDDTASTSSGNVLPSSTPPADAARNGNIVQNSCRVCSSIHVNQGQDDAYHCSYCEKNICHLNYCQRCSLGFCYSCCFRKYDDDIDESFVCISCFSE